LPLTESVSFKAVLQRGNRVQIPRLFRWQYRLEADQMLKVHVRIEGSFGDEKFLVRMAKDGRLTIPKLTSKLLQNGEAEECSEGSVLEITVEPADGQGEKPELNP
jgi:hypothetical protein